jgi:hypothetical protein
MDYATNLLRWPLLLLKGARALCCFYVALVTLRKDLSVSDNQDLQYNCEGYMALALVV